MKPRKHRKSSVDPNECPQGPGETWRYLYKGDYLIVTTVEEAPDLHERDGWRCVVLHGGAWNYKPSEVLNWEINARDGDSWERIT